MTKDIFKAYDIRGVYPDEINEDAAIKVARALARRWGKGEIVIAHDARLSSPALYKAILQSFKSEHLKLNVVAAGLATTPMFYFLVYRLKAAGGIMITASHNPKNFNGMKVVGPKSEVMSGTEIWNILNFTQNS